MAKKRMDEGAMQVRFPTLFHGPVGRPRIPFDRFSMSIEREGVAEGTIWYFVDVDEMRIHESRARLGDPLYGETR